MISVDIIIYDDGTNFEKNEIPKKTGSKIQYIFFSLLIPNIKK